jgi:hypothetical protein
MKLFFLVKHFDQVIFTTFVLLRILDSMLHNPYALNERNIYIILHITELNLCRDKSTIV